jgi:hypothetical protein
VLAAPVLLGIYARRQRLLTRPETWLVLLIAVLASAAATLPTPAMLSLVLWNGLVFSWFTFWSARERGRSPVHWIYAMPAIVLVWVNTHAAFILAAPFLIIVTVAAFFLLPGREARHAAVALALCGLATGVNPYGPRYPLQLVAETLAPAGRSGIDWKNPLQATFGAGGQYLHLPEFLVWMVFGTLAAGWLGGRRWGVVAALFLAYTPLNLVYARSTFLLPAIFGYGFLYLVRDARWPGPTAALASVLFLLLGGRAAFEARQRPETGTWMGFGIGYSQPVDEAEFLARGNYGARIYNTSKAGGYLIWRLFPRYQVMGDARGFRGELKQFTQPRDANQFQAFLGRHPGDIAVAGFQEDGVWRSFLKMPNWRPVFYGPSAAVFAHRDQFHSRVEAAASLERLRNGRDGARVFDFAIAVGDYRTAWSLLDQMEGPLRNQMDTADLDRMILYRAGHAALRSEDYSRAWECFELSSRHHPFEGQDKTILLILRDLLKAGPGDPRAGTFRAGLLQLMAGN